MMQTETQAMTRRQALGAVALAPVASGDMAPTPTPRPCWRCSSHIVGAGYQVAELEVEGQRSVIEWCTGCAQDLHSSLLERVRASFGRKP
jgi:hypothetical protein